MRRTLHAARGRAPPATYALDPDEIRRFRLLANEVVCYLDGTDFEAIRKQRRKPRQRMAEGCRISNETWNALEQHTYDPRLSTLEQVLLYLSEGGNQLKREGVGRAFIDAADHMLDVVAQLQSDLYHRVRSRYRLSKAPRVSSLRRLALKLRGPTAAS